MPISLEEFEKLAVDKKAAISQKYNELLEFLSGQAYTTAEVAVFLNISNTSAFSVLKRLEKKGVVIRRYDQTGKSYWTKAPEG